MVMRITERVNDSRGQRERTKWPNFEGLGSCDDVARYLRANAPSTNSANTAIPIDRTSMIHKPHHLNPTALTIHHYHCSAHPIPPLFPTTTNPAPCVLSLHIPLLACPVPCL